jgi:hypothetical protein
MESRTDNFAPEPEASISIAERRGTGSAGSYLSQEVVADALEERLREIPALERSETVEERLSSNLPTMEVPCSSPIAPREPSATLTDDEELSSEEEDDSSDSAEHNEVLELRSQMARLLAENVCLVYVDARICMQCAWCDVLLVYE